MLKQIIFNLGIAEIDSGGELLVTSEVSLQGHHTVQVYEQEDNIKK
jgi:hypothetical protein